MSLRLSPEEEKQIVSYFPVYLGSFIGQCLGAICGIIYLFDKEYLLSMLCILISIGFRLVDKYFLPPFKK
jgi:hypothetical protein